MAVNWSYPLNTQAALNSKRVCWLLANPTLDPALATTFYDLTARDPGTLASFTSSGGFQATTRTGAFSELRWDAGSVSAGASMIVSSSLPSSNTDFDFVPATGLSVFQWCKPSNNSILYQAQNGTPLVYLQCGNTTAGGTAHKFVVYLRANDGTTSIPINSTVTIDDGSWHHIGVVLNGTTYQLYIDGTADVSGAWTKAITISNGGFVEIGGPGVAASAGAVDDVTVFQRALTGANVTSLYNDALAGYTSTLNSGTRTKANYLINPATGNDGNDGIISPWQTIGKVNGFLQFAGDTYSFAGGQTISGNLHIQKAVPFLPGLQPILTVNSYGGGAATISCGDLAGVELDNVGNWNVNNIDTSGSGVGVTVGTPTITATTSSFAGIYAHNDGGQILPNVTINNVVVSGSLNGIELLATNLTGFSNVSISNCTVSGNGYYGIVVGPTFDGVHDMVQGQFSNITINKCVAFNNYGINSGAQAFQNTGYGIVVGCADGPTTSNCLVHDNGQGNPTASGAGPCGSIFFNCRSGVMTQNFLLCQFDPSGVDGQGWDLDAGCQNCTISFNYVAYNDNCGGQMFSLPVYPPNSNNVVCNNVYENNGRNAASPTVKVRGIRVASNGATTFNKFVNETVYSNYSGDAGSFLIQTDNAGSTSTTFTNCIFSIGAGCTITRTFANDYLIGNLYDTTQGATAMSYAGTIYANLAAIQALNVTGLERLSGVSYGSAAAAQFTNAGGGGQSLVLLSPSSIRAYDPLPGSPAYGNGVSTQALLAFPPSATDFHGNPTSRTGPVFDVGAVSLAIDAVVGFLIRPLAQLTRPLRAVFQLLYGNSVDTSGANAPPPAKLPTPLKTYKEPAHGRVWVQDDLCQAPNKTRSIR